MDFSFKQSWLGWTAFTSLTYYIARLRIKRGMCPCPPPPPPGKYFLPYNFFFFFNPNCTGLFRSMRILGRGLGRPPPLRSRTSEIVQRERPRCYFSQKLHILNFMQIICINNIFLNNFMNFTFCSVFLAQEVF